MLSYRHAFHAGNFADVLKHIVLVDILDHVVQKSAAYDYIDSHSGAGLYDLRAPETNRLQEHTTGIAQLDQGSFPELHRYLGLIETCNGPGPLSTYPGSPAVARYFLRPQDRAWLFELHPKDHQTLLENMRGNRNIRVAQEDGYNGMNALLPPQSRRAVVLIDPSYEIKSDYDRVVDAVIAAHRKFSQGIYAIWYPVVDRRRIDTMKRRIAQSNIRNVQRFELGVGADSPQRGMTSAGLFVVNPPWTLLDRMSQLLPRLAQVLSTDGEQHFKCEIVNGE